MQSKTSIAAMSLMTIQLDLTASLQGTTVITGGTFYGNHEYALTGVTSNQFTTIHSVSYRLEDVGSLEVITIEFFADFTYNGNGTLRFQISGDGGSSWTTMAQGNFNVGVKTADLFTGKGTWITNVQAGANKFQIRLQALANSGTVNITLFDDTYILFTYRKKVLN